MKITQYTSLPISRLIHERFPEVETEYCWLEASDGARLMKVPTHATYKYFTQTPAYTFTDVLHAIKVLRERDGAEPAGYQCASGCGCIYGGTAGHELACKWGWYAGDVATESHSLLTAYVSDGLEFGVESEKVIRNIFEV